MSQVGTQITGITLISMVRYAKFKEIYKGIDHGGHLIVVYVGQLMYIQIFFVAKPAKQFQPIGVAFLKWPYITHI